MTPPNRRSPSSFASKVPSSHRQRRKRLKDGMDRARSTGVSATDSPGDRCTGVPCLRPRFQSGSKQLTNGIVHASRTELTCTFTLRLTGASTRLGSTGAGHMMNALVPEQGVSLQAPLHGIRIITDGH